MQMGKMFLRIISILFSVRLLSTKSHCNQFIKNTTNAKSLVNGWI